MHTRIILTVDGMEFPAVLRPESHRRVKGDGTMVIFDPGEKVENLAEQCLNYDRYCCCRYFLERVDVHGKYGLVCGEEVEECGSHSKVLLEPIYDEITVSKVSSSKALYDRYAVLANGEKVGEFTLVLNSWVLRHN